MFSTVEPKPIRKNNFNPPIIKDWHSDDESEVEISPTSKVKIFKPSIEKIKFVKTARETVKNEESPEQHKHPCYVCGSFEHLQYVCDKKDVRPIRNNSNRVNHKNFANKLTHPHPKKGFVPQAVLTRLGKINTAGASVNTAAIPVNSAGSKSTVNHPRLKSKAYKRVHSQDTRPINKFLANQNSIFNKKVNTVRVNDSTARDRVVSGNMIREIYVYNGLDPQKSLTLLFYVHGNPQQKEYKEKRVIDNGCSRTLAEAARTMLVDFKFPTTFWAEAVNTACYVLNRALVTKPRNKTPYELIRGRPPLIDFMKPFGCPVTILNTRDNLGKFEGKADEGYFVGYSVDPKKTLLQDSTVNAGTKAPEVDENEASDNGGKNDQVLRIGSSFVNAASQTLINAVGHSTNDTGIFGNAYDDEVLEEEVDITNVDLSYTIPEATKFLKDHPQEQVIGSLETPVQTRQMSKTHEEFGLLSSVYKLRRTNHKTFKINKKDEKGIVIKNKARLVAQGHTQEEGIDYDEIFTSVARIKAIRLFLAYASFQDFVVYQIDVKSAFLYERIEEEVYDYQPLRGQIDKSLFIKRHKDDILLVQVYVDDIILGHQVKQKSDGIFIIQDKYVAEVVKKFDFVNVKTASTQMESNKPLIKDEEAEDVDVHLYRSMIVSLMYLTTSKPDITFAVYACPRFQVNLKTSHLQAVKRIFRDLKGQPQLGLWYPKDSPFNLEAYTNSDDVGASLDRKSTTGGCQFLGKGLISWQCKKQTIIANSTTEAEYVAAANCCRQVLWIQNQMLDYGFNLMNTKSILSTICIVKNPVNDKEQIQALVDKTKVIITEDSIRSDLRFDDSEGTACLLNEVIFEGLACMGPKTTAWNEFSSTMAYAFICLADNQKFNFSKYIFDNMVKSLEGRVKFYLFARFLQVFLDKQVEGMARHKEMYIISSHTKKIFANMRRIRVGFSGVITPLFDSMMVQSTADMGDTLVETHQRPIVDQPLTFKPHKKQQPRRKQRKEAEVSHDVSEDEDHVPTPSSDPLPSGEDSSILNELMVFYTSLQEQKKSRSRGLRRLKKIGSGRRVKSPMEKDGLGAQEDASKHGRMIEEIDQNAEIALDDETQGRTNDDEMLGVNDLDGEEVVMETTTSVKDSAAPTTNVTKYEVTMAQALAALKSTKPRVVVQEQEMSTTIPVAATIVTTVVPTPRAKGIVFHKQKQSQIPTGRSFDEIKELFDKVMTKVNDFIAMDLEAQESSTKRKEEHLESDISKKQNVDENVKLVIDDSEKLKKYMEIVPDNGDEVLIEATPISSRSPTIIDYKIHKEGKKNYFKIIRADGNSQVYQTSEKKFKNFNREDLEVLYNMKIPTRISQGEELEAI
nr:hypothetical protein [Tanacetum cinerariifolium]